VHIHVNGVKLYFDVEGLGLRPEGPAMVQKPTLLLLHGGPGADHSLYKPAFSALTDVAQVVYLDHRGNGRSDYASADSWNLNQWADDVHGFCQALGITKPIVYGASFGGMVAMAYAARYPQHPAKLALVSTAGQPLAHAQARVTMFKQLGGEAAGQLAHRRFVEGDTSPAVLQAWLQVALPLYTQVAQPADNWHRGISNPAATAWFNRPGGEAATANLLPGLARIACPTLVWGGALDPMLPIECQRDVAAAVPPQWLHYREFAQCGHGIVPDAPAEAMALLRAFITAA
jgi:pimeloyl-ACP methyl ester carboxylesterase